MQLITEAAVRLTSNIERVLAIGCGAGNNTLKLREVYVKPFTSDLLDLSGPMLERAKQRVKEAGIDSVTVWQAGLRDADLPKESYDVILAAAVLHHLRDDADWQTAFEKVYSLLRPGGSFWITDLVVQESVPIHELMWSRYGDYLEGIGAEYRQKVFDYIEREDSPWPVTYHLDLLRRVGFTHIELLHKNSCFAAFGAWKALEDGQPNQCAVRLQPESLAKPNWRSPTAEAIDRDDSRVSVRSRGTARAAKQTIRSADLEWADLVLAMEDKHRRRLLADYPGETRFLPIEVLQTQTTISSWIHSWSNWSETPPSRSSTRRSRELELEDRVVFFLKLLVDDRANPIPVTASQSGTKHYGLS